MLTKKQCVSKFEQILNEKYPNDGISFELLDMINFDIAQLLSQKQTLPHQTVKLRHPDGNLIDIDKTLQK